METVSSTEIVESDSKPAEKPPVVSPRVRDLVAAQLDILDGITGPEGRAWTGAVQRRDAAMRALDHRDLWALGVLGGTLTNISRG